MTTLTPLLKIDSVGKTFADGTNALGTVSLDISPGEFVVVLGPSGSGKTTLLRIINGLLEPTKGEITLDGQKISAKVMSAVRKKVGMIFQDFNLVGNLSTINNVLTGLLNTNRRLATLFYIFPKAEKLKALAALDQVGLLEKADTRADHLSGGQQQRVGIARALVKKPLLLLADEPVASLDPMIAYSILSLMKEINRTFGITVICNLHQVDLALNFADRIIGLSSGNMVLDAPVSEVNEDYIRSIYQGHDQGVFYGPAPDYSSRAETIHRGL